MITQLSKSDKSLMILISENENDVKTLEHLYKTAQVFGMHTFWKKGDEIKHDQNPLFDKNINTRKEKLVAEALVEAIKKKYNAEAIGIVNASQQIINE
jgi:hypothetical protein